MLSVLATFAMEMRRHARMHYGLQYPRVGSVQDKHTFKSFMILCMWRGLDRILYFTSV